MQPSPAIFVGGWSGGVRQNKQTCNKQTCTSKKGGIQGDSLESTPTAIIYISNVTGIQELEEGGFSSLEICGQLLFLLPTPPPSPL